MNKKQQINSITLGGIFAAIYMILTLLSVYLFSILSVFGLILMPVFAAYYASIYRVKETFLFNLATLIVCLICAVQDPFFVLLYILPTLIIGDLFGLLNHLKIPFYATLFLQSLAYSLTNYLAIILAQMIYQTNIISVIIPSVYIYQNFSLCILFVLSGAEAIVATTFVSEQLARLKIVKEKETAIGLSGMITIGLCFILTFFFSYISNNFCHFFFFIGIILSIPQLFAFIHKIKYKELFLALFAVVMICLCFYLSYLEKYRWILFSWMIPFLILDIANLIIYIYNINKKGREKDV